MEEWNEFRWPAGALHHSSINFIYFWISLRFQQWVNLINSNQIQCGVSAFHLMELIDWRIALYILLHQHPSSQSTKYLFDFDLRLFPQHRYTYCYNNFVLIKFIPLPKRSEMNWFKQRNKFIYWFGWWNSFAKWVEWVIAFAIPSFINQIKFIYFNFNSFISILSGSEWNERKGNERMTK